MSFWRDKVRYPCLGGASKRRKVEMRKLKKRRDLGMCFGEIREGRLLRYEKGNDEVKQM